MVQYLSGWVPRTPLLGAAVQGYGVYFGDERDVAEPIYSGEGQTNDRGDIRAALRALHGHVRSLICPESTYVVDGSWGVRKSGAAIHGKHS